MEFFKAPAAVMVPEPYARVQFLGACKGCGAPHPLATNYWKTRFADNEHCPQCGEPSEAPGPEKEVPVALSGIWGFLFHLVVGIGKGLLKLGRWIMPKKE